MLSLRKLTEVLHFARRKGAQHVGVCYWDKPPFGFEPVVRWAGLNLSCLIQVNGKAAPQPRTRGKHRVLSSQQAVAFEPLDAIVVTDKQQFAWILRAIEGVLQRDLLVLPADPSWIVSPQLTNLKLSEALQESVPAEYLARSGLNGHYLEFGTYWGRSFFPAYFRLREVLSKGSFYAFDSFAGLSQPDERETEYTGGDYRPNTYNFNLRSFRGLAELVGMEAARLKVVSGYYEQTLIDHRPQEYGLEPESVAACVIDCDLYDPTRIALDFVTPLLQPGALLYFDDWRLCRASPDVGERAAALDWLRRNPAVELTELHRTHWQNQWFIFNRNRKTSEAPT